MCGSCGCSEHDHLSSPEKTALEVKERILSANDRQAEVNRQLFNRAGVLAVNLISSPGAGKTSLLEKTAEWTGGRLRIGVIEGDLETDTDAERLRSVGVPAYQITTGQACHLDAFMVHEGIQHLPLEDLDLLFIENVGNLVCPAGYDLGAHLNVVLLSTTEGEDKPAKYPVAFRCADMMLVTKWDLLPHTDFDFRKAAALALKVNPKLRILKVSSKTGEGFPEWVSSLEEKGSEVWRG